MNLDAKIIKPKLGVLELKYIQFPEYKVEYS